MTTEAEQARREFRRYRREAGQVPMAAERWRYWSTLARIKNMRQAGLEWAEIADLLGLDSAQKALWAVRQGDRRVSVAQEVLAEPRRAQPHTPEPVGDCRLSRAQTAGGSERLRRGWELASQPG